MAILRLYRSAQVIVWSLLLIGLLVWYFGGLSEQGSAQAIYADTETVGRVCQCAEETLLWADRVRKEFPQYTEEDADRVRAQAELLEAAADQLLASTENARSAYVPVDQATALLISCEQLIGTVLDQSLSYVRRQADSMGESLGATASETAAVITAAVEPVERQVQQLRASASRDVAHGLLGQGGWLGVARPDFLMAALALAATISSAVLIHAMRRCRIPAAALENTELELAGTADRVAALRRCHERVAELLELAQRFCRSDKT